MVDDDSDAKQIQTSLDTSCDTETLSEELENSDTTHSQDSLEQILSARIQNMIKCAWC